MIKIQISEQIKTAIPSVELGVISANVKFEKKNILLWQAIDEQISRITKLTTEGIKTIPQIHSTRLAYKTLGKEPSRYRPSAEALHRRLVRGKGMYQINNLVDTINLASIATGYSIGGYNEEKIDGKIIFKSGDAQSEYQAIGRGLMNIENLPVFYDNIGAFGSPTSDSERTMITDSTNKILLIVMNFGGHPNFTSELNQIVKMIEDFCYGSEIETKIVC